MSQKSTVIFHWRQIDDFPFPRDKRFACTGFREDEGIEEMFSIMVNLKGDGDVREASEAELEALVDSMSSKLPKCGERFYITSGKSVVAECVGKS
jgi:hypothetical protein